MSKKQTITFEDFLNQKRIAAYTKTGYSAVIDKAVAKQEYDQLYPEPKESKKKEPNQ